MNNKALINESVIKKLIFVLLLITGLSLRFHNISYPLILTQDTGYIPTFAKNLSQTDISENKLIPVRNYYKDTGHIEFHQAHPSMTHNLLSIMFRTFGVKESVYRIFNIVTGGVVGIFALFMLLRMFLGDNTALGALFFWAIIPSSSYFERMFSMTMQAYSMILLFLYLFFRYFKDRSRLNRILLISASVTGPLFDWHYLFIYLFLFIYALKKREYLKMTILTGGISGLMLGMYLLHSNISVYTEKVLSVSNISEGWWWEYIKIKFGLFKIFNMEYSGRVWKLFTIHYTKWMVVIFIIWLCFVLYKTLIKKEKLNNLFLMLYLLFSPGIFYIAMVPHNTIGHIWTLYCLWPSLALIFGSLTAFILKSRKLLGIAGVLIISLPLIYFSSGYFTHLHKISEYHLINTRIGNICSIYAGDDTYLYAENYDTLSFYTDMPVKGAVGNYGYMTEVLKKRGDKPTFVTLNQKGYINLNIVENSNKSEKFIKLNDFLKEYGFRLWLKSPAYVWTNFDTSDNYFIMDQYTVPFSMVRNDSSLHLKDCFAVGNGKLMRGIYQEMGNKRATVTRFMGIKTGDYNLFSFSAVNGGKGDKIDTSYRVEVEHNGKTDTIYKNSMASDEEYVNISVDISAYKAKQVNIVLVAEATDNKNRSFYWLEPRLEKKESKRKFRFRLKSRPDIYIDGRKFIKVEF